MFKVSLNCCCRSFRYVVENVVPSHQSLIQDSWGPCLFLSFLGQWKISHASLRMMHAFSRCFLSGNECPDLTAYAAVLKHPQFSNLGEFQMPILHDVKTGLGNCPWSIPLSWPEFRESGFLLLFVLIFSYSPEEVLVCTINSSCDILKNLRMNLFGFPECVL